ncbi:hypothetical protein G6F60_013853 [Rhizopus arrhizus]|nr:hypothetical protein G6F60_013853 [Rhizopus arrhizus]
MHRFEVAGTDRQRAEDAGQQRHGQHRRPEARRHRLGHRIDRHQFQRLDLVGGSHQAQFGGDGTAGATDEQQRGQHRRQFAVQRQAEQGRQRVGRPEGGQRAVTLQGQHQADESAADGDDRQRARADLGELAGQLGQEITRGQRTAQHGQREQAGAAQRTGTAAAAGPGWTAAPRACPGTRCRHWRWRSPGRRSAGSRARGG